MKRQGRQHGMVRTFPIVSVPPRPRPRNLNELRSTPTAGVFTRVSTKPTNHSKFTGKCGRPKCRDCHDYHPACKSKEKTKGAQKSRSSSDTMSSYRLISWRVVDGSPGLKFSGFSASGVLDYLGSDHEREGEYDEYMCSGVEIEGEEEEDDVDDDGMSFCEVGFVSVEEDDNWCVIDEM